jgi:hypothetical protein
MWCTPPLDSEIDTADRIARLRSLRAAVHLQLRHHVGLIVMLPLAETGDAEWVSCARVELDGLPSSHRRRLLAGYAAMRARS